jgi:hypothetical protein
MGSGPLESRKNLISFGNLLFDRPVHIGKRSFQSAQHALQSFNSWTLARKGNLLNHFLPEELINSVDFPSVYNVLDELPYDVAICLHCF